MRVLLICITNHYFSFIASVLHSIGVNWAIKLLINTDCMLYIKYVKYSRTVCLTLS